MKKAFLFLFIFPLFLAAQSPHPYSFYRDSCQYDVKSYRFLIHMNDSSTFIRSKVLIHAVATADIKRVILEFNSSLKIDTLLLNNVPAKFTNQNDLISVQLPAELKKDDHFYIRVVYYGTVKPKGLWGGFRNENDNRYKTSVTWTLSEPYFANAWFPCKQQLSDKIDSVEMNLVVPKRIKGASNGLLQSVTSYDARHDCYKWLTTYPIAYYLIFASAADYQDYSYYVKIFSGSVLWDAVTGETHNNESNDSLLVQNFIYNRPGLLNALKPELDRTGDIIRLYSQLFGPYPFRREKYGHAMAPFGGGMEHQTMSLMYYFQFHLVAHELAHQWFGDYTTCSDWQNIFINESMASYAEYIAHEKLETKKDAEDWLVRAQTLARSNKKGSVYLPASDSTNEDRIFSYELSYKKGALVLHILRNEINNDDVFFSILRSFLYKYRFATASVDDFRRAVEEQTGKSFKSFFDQWVIGQGYPEYTIRHKQRFGNLIINSEQKGTSKVTSLFNVTMEFLISDDDGDRIIRLYQSKNKEQWSVPVKGKVIKFIPDPDNKILKDLSEK